MTTDRASGSALLVLALGVAWESRRLPLGTYHGPGPGYFPLLLAAGLAVLALAIVVRGRVEVDRLFGRPPAYTREQLAPIALLSADPTVLVVRAASPW
jgi:hypothetical protein